MHFFAYEDLPASGNYAGCYWRVNNVDALCAEFQAADLSRFDASRLSAVENKPWGMREFAIVDPNGNLVRVGQDSASQR